MPQLIARIKSWFGSADPDAPPSRRQMLRGLVAQQNDLADQLRKVVDRLDQHGRQTSAMDESVGQLPQLSGEQMRLINEQGKTLRTANESIDALREATDSLASAIMRMDGKLDQVLTSQERSADAMQDAAATVRRDSDSAQSTAARARLVIIILSSISALAAAGALGVALYLLQQQSTSS